MNPRAKPRNLRVGAAQMTSGPDLNANLHQAEGLIANAVSQNVQFLAFPENFVLLSDDKDSLREHAQGPRGPLVRWLSAQAKKHRMAILAGSLPWEVSKSHQKIGNTSVLMSAQGRILATYQKIHLFDVRLSDDRVYEESKRIAPGHRSVTVPLRWTQNRAIQSTRLGLSICYDLRFPELYRQLANQGAEVLMIPSAFTQLTGQAHWDSLTRARAIESQCFVIAPAQCGSPYEGRWTHGHTRIIDPWGRVLAERAEGIGLVVADLDFQELTRVRRELPSLTHQRLKTTGFRGRAR